MRRFTPGLAVGVAVGIALSTALVGVAAVSVAFAAGPELVRSRTDLGSVGYDPPYRVVRVGEPAYVTSGAWSPFGLLLFDASRNRLLRLESDGSLTEMRELDGVATRVAALTDAGDLLVQWTRPDRWVTVRTTATDWSIRDRWSCEGCSLKTWSPLTGQRVLAAGELTDPEDETVSQVGIFWVTPDGPELAYPLPAEDLPLFLYGFQWVAALGGHGYAVVPEPPREDRRPRRLEILDLTPNNTSPRILARLPAPRPDLSFPTMDSVSRQMHAASALQVPQALLGWENSLYLFLRTAQGMEVWKLDPIDGGLHFLDVLPTSEFVTIVPGPEDWALVQKGPVVGLGQQQVQSVVLVPSERFR